MFLTFLKQATFRFLISFSQPNFFDYWYILQQVFRSRIKQNQYNFNLKIYYTGLIFSDTLNSLNVWRNHPRRSFPSYLSLLSKKPSIFVSAFVTILWGTTEWHIITLRNPFLCWFSENSSLVLHLFIKHCSDYGEIPVNQILTYERHFSYYHPLTQNTCKQKRINNFERHNKNRTALCQSHMRILGDSYGVI